MLALVRQALDDLSSPPFRRALLASVALTLGTLVALLVAIEVALTALLVVPYPYVETAVAVLSGFGLVILFAFMVAPVAALYAGLFLDRLAETIERAHYPADLPGRPLPLVASIAQAAAFALVVLAVNAVALPLVLLLGFGVLVFLVANGYLIGREYFTFAALRFHDPATAALLRRRHSGEVMLAGLFAAAILGVPVVNLAAPFFATALMVHLHKRVEREERRPGGLLAPAGGSGDGMAAHAGPTARL